MRGPTTIVLVFLACFAALAVAGTIAMFGTMAAGVPGSGGIGSVSAGIFEALVETVLASGGLRQRRLEVDSSPTWSPPMPTLPPLTKVPLVDIQ